MYLKSIEIQGFKSFANRIKFEFNDGITGIVGPNGSGKSNVADAVRWVLGEQRVKQLRGGNMQDVIFSGTENRKPMSYASVSITLDNSDHALPVDYEEVTVARRLYRSGESEYLMNGAACRLRDVNELFYDTGIGKEGYSIIGQGQIERILSEKPEDRRELFDEAAGIVKFKRRKSMTQKKLEDEHANLTRVTDILTEIENQLGPLEKQSQTAKEYLKKKDELRTYDINMFLLESDRIRDHLTELEEQLKIVSDELADNNQIFENTRNEYDRIEEKIDETDAELEGFREQLNQTTILKTQLENQIELLKEQINSIRSNDEQIGKRSLAIQSEIDKRKEDSGKLNEERKALEQSLESCRKELRKSENDLAESGKNISALENEIESGKSAIISALNERVTIKSKLQRYDTMAEQGAGRKAQVNGRLISLKADLEEQERIVSDCKDKERIILDKVKEQTDQLSEMETRVSIVSGELRDLEKKVQDDQNAYHRENSRRESLINLTERYDGYGNSIRKVMEKKTVVSGIIGVVADIIKTEKKYEIAVETALGGAIQNIVVEDEDTAKDMIRYLKDNRLGRATFLPLTSVRTSELKEKDALNEKGVIGIASELVRTDDSYKNIASHLLGRTLVVGSIDDGIAIARKYKHKLKIVTLEGELFQPGGSMTGGAFKNSSNLLGRRREIEELEKRTADLLKNLETSTVLAAEKKKEKGSCYDQIDRIGGILHDLKLEETTVTLNRKAAEEQQAELQKEYQSLESERKQLDKQALDLDDLKRAVSQELDASGLFEKQTQDTIDSLSIQLEEAQKLMTEAQKKHEEIRLKNLEFEQKDRFLAENLSRLLKESDDLREELHNLELDKSDSAQEILEKEENIRSIEKTIAESAELFDEIRGEIDRMTEERERLNMEHRSFIEKREALSSHIAELDKELFRLNSRKEGYDKSLEEQIAYMWDEYELTYNHALKLRDVNLTNLTLIKKQITSLKSEMKALGPVNVNAIEEYKQLLERYNFLSGQREDLVTAENSLISIIDELDDGMRHQFEEQFARINTEFNKVFQKLFGGGHGKLELVEEEDILEAGIRIIAQPPGKKLQNMVQMSGGEKSLTAIALLFAIQCMKPSPFCLLDEIEAALDDANVSRFADYLKYLTKHTQFIMITHRRGTMAAADRLYGITMQEKGVSTLVSVDLLEDKLDA